MGSKDADKVRDRSPIDRKGAARVGGGAGGNAKRAPPERRVFVSNIPYDMKWQDVKDLFRSEVGEVTHVEMFNDEDDKPRGCAIVELASADLAEKAVETMHRKDFKGRKLVVLADFDNERDKHGRIVSGSSRGGGGNRRSRGGAGGRDRGGGRDRDPEGDSGDEDGGDFGGGRRRSRGNRNLDQRLGGQVFYGNTYGLSVSFLESLGIDCPIHSRLFVANLDYTVDEKKLREVFRLAGRVVMVELNRDKEGKSRGHGVVEFDHPVEAVQAISMLNEQTLFDRKITVRMDKMPGPSPEELNQPPDLLPEGLSGVGMGLGVNGNPLVDVVRNLSNSNNHSAMAMPGASPMLGGPSASSSSFGGPMPMFQQPQPQPQPIQAQVGASAAAMALSALTALAANQGSAPVGVAANNLPVGGNQQAPVVDVASLLQALTRQVTSGGGGGGMQGLGGVASSSAAHSAATSSAGNPGMMMGGGGGNSMMDNNLQGGWQQQQENKEVPYKFMGVSGGGGSSSAMQIGGGSGGMGQLGGGHGVGQGSGSSGGMRMMGGGGGPGNSGNSLNDGQGGPSRESLMSDMLMAKLNQGRSSSVMPSSSSSSDLSRVMGLQSSIGMGGGSGSYSTGSGSLMGNPVHQRPQVMRSDTVVVRNLPDEFTWKMLKEGFEHCGNIKYAEVKDTGTGLIQFVRETDAERAATLMNKQMVAGHLLDVRLY